MNRKHDPDAIEGWLTELWSAADQATRAPRGFDERLFARIAADDAAAARAVSFLPRAFDGLPWWVRATGQRTTVLAFLVLGTAAAAPRAIFETPSSLQGAGVAVTTWLNALLASFAAPALTRVVQSHSGIALALGVMPIVVLVSLELARRAQSWAYGLRVIRLGARS